MLSPLIDISTIDNTIFETLYQVFHRDFIKTRTLLNGSIWINPRSYLKEDGKEKDFWHLVTRDTKNRSNDDDRLLDSVRAERLPWIKNIIDHHTHHDIKSFYYMEQGKKIRLYLWLQQENFVVIVQKLGASECFLVTSFFITYDKKKRDFQKRYDDYMNFTDHRLKSCEWF